LGSGGDTGRSEDLDAVLGSDGGQLLAAGRFDDAGGSVRVRAGSDMARTKSAKGAGSVTIRKRASVEVTGKVCGMSRGPYTNDPRDPSIPMGGVNC
jgi:hypothetical protein